MNARITDRMNETLGLVLKGERPGWERIESVSACLYAGLLDSNSDTETLSVTAAGRASFEAFTAKNAAKRAKRSRYAKARRQAINDTMTGIGLVRTRSGAWE